MQVVRQRPRRRLPTVVRQPRRLNQFLDALRASHCPAEKPIVLIVFDIGRSENLPLVAARPRGRDLVHVPAHEHRRVAGLGQRAGQRRRRDRLPKEPHDAARLRVQAGQQGIPRRDAGRHRGIGAAEECPLLGQFIQLRCPHARMAQDRQAIAPHLIRHQEEHIRLGGLALRSASGIAHRERTASRHRIRSSRLMVSLQRFQFWLWPDWRRRRLPRLFFFGFPISHKPQDPRSLVGPWRSGGWRRSGTRAWLRSTRPSGQLNGTGLIF